MTSLDSTAEESSIAPLLSASSTRLRSLILKKHITTLYTQFKKENKADPNLTRLILLNVFQIFQVTKINFDQYLKLHEHPDTNNIQCDATTQTEYTTIRPKPFSRTLSNRSRSELEKQNLTSYWPSDDCDTTDDELQQDPPEASIDNNSVHKTYTYVSFDDNLQSTTTQMTPFNKGLPRRTDCSNSPR